MLFPALAQAEDASGIQYSEAPPTATGGHEKTHHEPSAKSSNSGGGATAPGDSKQANSSSGSGKGSGAGNSSSNAGDSPGGGGTGQGNPAGGLSGGEGSSPQQTDQQASAVPTSHESDSGSSPLVPILIAIAVLAAISIGALVLRSRRQRGEGGTPVSPGAS
jgi:cobalamin biosynthesis Mg chelatase CobN